jgi:hypothetical protein
MIVLGIVSKLNDLAIPFEKIAKITANKINLIIAILRLYVSPSENEIMDINDFSTTFLAATSFNDKINIIKLRYLRCTSFTSFFLIF